MDDINNRMPKLSNKYRWGALMNWKPTNVEIEDMMKTFPSDQRWHSMIKGGNEMMVDGKVVRERTGESMT